MVLHWTSLARLGSSLAVSCIALAHVLDAELSELYPKIDWKKAREQRTGEE
jgi:hypothetical protein